MTDPENKIDQYDDIDIDTPSKLDSVWLGMMVGIVLPVLAFVMFYYGSFAQVPFHFFIQYSLKIGALINILTVSLIPNFLIFALFIWRRHYSSAKGMVIASASFTVLFILLRILIALYLE
jgi:hypothetical protein